MRVFTALLSPEIALARYRAHLHLTSLGTETVSLGEALDRILAGDLSAPGDLPPFDRSTVDGYAVRAADVERADATSPVRLRLAGEVQMGEAAGLALRPGETARVPTGGMLPAGCDAVAMQEHCVVEGPMVAVRRPARPGENVIARGEDVRAGEVVLREGRRLQPQDLGILAGLGYEHVAVRVRPRVAILSSGDEIVPPGIPPAPGQVRDMNTYAVSALVQRLGGIPAPMPILPDDYDIVLRALREAVRTHDMVLISGGSSVGERDVVVDAIRALGPPGIIVHGIAIRPGKPTVLAAAGDRPVIGLPGNPVSAMVIVDVFVRPVLHTLLGLGEARRFTSLVRARAAESMPGAGEREDHVRVTLEARDGDLWARPLPTKSGLLTSMVRADGIVVIRPGSQVAEGERVEVDLLDG